MIPKPVPDVGIVVAAELDLGILDQRLLGPELGDDVLFDLGGDSMRGRSVRRYSIEKPSGSALGNA